ncbi:MAG: trypsin-like peptidase domain-containing protein [Myxococcota bacterium]
MKRFFVISAAVCTLCVLPLTLVASANQGGRGVIQAFQRIIPASTSRNSLPQNRPPKSEQGQFTKPPVDLQPDHGNFGAASPQGNLDQWQQQLQQCASGYSLISLAPVVKEIAPAVLAVSTESLVSSPSRNIPPQLEGSPFEDFFRFFGPPQREGAPKRHVEGWGSAFVVSADPKQGVLALTNHHVVEKADTIKVKAYDGRVYDAELVGSHEDTDVALLRIKSEHFNWKVLPLAQTAVRVGDRVIAMGNTLALGTTASEGIVSGLGRSKVFPSGRKGLFNFIQITAPISPGNSGGPSVRIDLDNNCKPQLEVIGMNTAMAPHGQNVGFSTPAEIIKPVYDQLREPPHKVISSWLGVMIRSMDWKLAKELGIDPPRGAVVVTVVPGGPADKAGIQAGDVILEFDSVPLRDEVALPVAAGLKGVGKTVPVMVFRRGAQPAEFKLLVTLGKRPENEEAEDMLAGEEAQVEIPILGLWVTHETKTLPESHRRQLGLPANTKGVRVAKISPTAKRLGFALKDVLVKVNNQVISNVTELKKAIKAAKPKKLLHIYLVRGKSIVYYAFPKPAERPKQTK